MQPPSPTPPVPKPYKGSSIPVIPACCRMATQREKRPRSPSPESSVGPPSLFTSRPPSPDSALSTGPVQKKKKTFDERFETATKSNEEVLGEPSFLILFISLNLQSLVQTHKWRLGHHLSILIFKAHHRSSLSGGWLNISFRVKSPSMWACYILFSFIANQALQLQDCALCNPLTLGRIYQQPQPTCQKLRWEEGALWTEHRRFCPWVNLHKIGIPLSRQSLGRAVPPTFRHHRRSATPPNAPYAICKGRCPLCYHSISRCERNLSNIESQCREIPPGGSFIQYFLAFLQCRSVFLRQITYRRWWLDIAKCVCFLRYSRPWRERGEAVFPDTWLHQVRVTLSSSFYSVNYLCLD